MTRPSNYQAHTVLPAARLNADYDAKADLDAGTGKLLDAQVPASVTSGISGNAAAIAAINANANAAGGFARLLSGGKLPLGILPYSAGANISIDPSGVISSTGGGGGQTLTPPTAADFPLSINEGMAPYSYMRQTARGLKVAFQNIRSANGMRMRLHPVPAAGTPWQVVMAFALPSFAWASQGVGVSRYDSATGKNAQYCLTSELVPYGTGSYQSNVYENVWANDYSTYLSGGWLASVPGISVLWMRMTDTGTMDGSAWLLEISRSGDADDWFPIRGGAREAYLGTAPTHFGLSAACPSGNVLSAPDPTMTVLHYVKTGF